MADISLVSFLGCSGHQSFSNNKALNDFIGHLTHSSILVPYHGWRISHRTHHSNHGHVENDESWHPVSKNLYDDLVRPGERVVCPIGVKVEWSWHATPEMPTTKRMLAAPCAFLVTTRDGGALQIFEPD